MEDWKFSFTPQDSAKLEFQLTLWEKQENEDLWHYDIEHSAI